MSIPKRAVIKRKAREQQVTGQNTAAYSTDSTKVGQYRTIKNLLLDHAVDFFRHFSLIAKEITSRKIGIFAEISEERLSTVDYLLGDGKVASNSLPIISGLSRKKTTC